ncbi:DUF6504 family protein [Micropruina sp.]|uniref:DUF6504 family protein n=1 Tax=Micropruina sp. TaxID=2737536 RepID=UPI0039E620DC
MRRYDEAIEVRQGLVGGDEGPAQFLWRRRLWKVLELQTRWVETADWWNSTQVRVARGEDAAGPIFADGEGDDLLGEQEVWRVVAADGRHGSSGVYELARSWGSGVWRLRTVVD